MLSRGRLLSTTRHIARSGPAVRERMQLAACANGVRMRCLVGCACSCSAMRARRSSAGETSSAVVLAHSGNLAGRAFSSIVTTPARRWGKVDCTLPEVECAGVDVGGTTWWRPILPASGADRGLRLVECEYLRPWTNTGLAAMLMGWGLKSTYRKTGRDGLRGGVGSAVGPLARTRRRPPTSAWAHGRNFTIGKLR